MVGVAVVLRKEEIAALPEFEPTSDIPGEKKSFPKAKKSPNKEKYKKGKTNEKKEETKEERSITSLAPHEGSYSETRELVKSDSQAGSVKDIDTGAKKTGTKDVC